MTEKKPPSDIENALIKLILDGELVPGDKLPGERTLCTRFGVTRPTLREALTRLQRDGWVRIQHGKPTVISNFKETGGLNVLSALAEHRDQSLEFVEHLLEVRTLLAPTYVRAAYAEAPDSVSVLLQNRPRLNDIASIFAHYDWKLHHGLSLCGPNPVYTFILNGFRSLSMKMGTLYFSSEAGQRLSLNFYNQLEEALNAKDPDKAYRVTQETMQKSLIMWQEAMKERGTQL